MYKDLFAGRPKFAVLIDPDHEGDPRFDQLLHGLSQGGVDCILVGGSTTQKDNIDRVVQKVRASRVPVLLFPGEEIQISAHADGILLPSLISGRNPDYLIGKHVSAAMRLQEANIPICPMGYILIDGGRVSTTAYITQTMPIPAKQSALAAQTALAGQHLGMKCIYLEAGSGAHQGVAAKTISLVKQTIDIPLIVGGGLSEPADITRAISAGADMIVVGTRLEQDPDYLSVLLEAFATQMA